MEYNFFGTLKHSSPTYTVTEGFVASIYDADGSQTITVVSGASLSLKGATGANIINLSGASSEWQVLRDGSTVIFLNTLGDRIEIPSTIENQTIRFNDSIEAKLRIDTSGVSPSVKFGTQTIEPIASKVNAWSSEDSGTGKLAWTLMMPVSGAVFKSDGTPDGTGLMGSPTNSAAVQDVLLVNSDATKTFRIGARDGTGGQIASFELNSRYVDGGDIYYEQFNFDTRSIILANTDFLTVAFLTDFTKNESYNAQPNSAKSYMIGRGYMGDGVADEVRRMVWLVDSSRPYGSELAVIRIAEDGEITEHIVDVAPGTESGVVSLDDAMILPDGRLIFTTERYSSSESKIAISDGTIEGTFFLSSVDEIGRPLFSAAEDTSYQLTKFGDQIAFTADHIDYYQDPDNPLYSFGPNKFWGSIGIVDPSTLNINWLDFKPSHDYPFGHHPTYILGTINDALYFIAQAVNGWDQDYAIFKISNNQVVRIASYGSSALLGWSDTHAFFCASDSAHGDELWVANFSEGDNLTRITDLIPGTGSALPYYYNWKYNEEGEVSDVLHFMLNNKLVFTAYSGARTQGVFVSDGTEEGTVQISTSAVHISSTCIIGSKLFFADDTGIKVADLSEETVCATLWSGLPESSYRVTIPFQADSDQVFFRLGNGDLYSSDGTAEGTIKLFENVAVFKVFGENNIFFSPSTDPTTEDYSSLWFSDGTTAGTRFIEDFTFYFTEGQFQDAVAIHTVGVVDG
jgi:ELWxxDGT repeat protein